MHTDSLLDFLHVYTSPALLFNLQGELLFSNRAAELCQGGEIATEIQAQQAIFNQPDKSIPSEIQTAIYVKTQAEEFNFRFSTPAPVPPTAVASSSSARGSSHHARSSSSRPSSSSSTARPTSSSSSSSSSRPRSAKRRSRPTSRSGFNGPSDLSGAVNETANDALNNEDNEWMDEDYPTPTGFSVERRQLHWKVTKTRCRRIVALAQEKATTDIPTTCDKDMEIQKEITPVIRTPWQSQPRFESLKKGGGVMGDRIRNFDWANHPLGAISSWPQARVEMVGLILRSPVPMTAYLEQPAYVLYNDAYIAVLGQTKHRAGGELHFFTQT